MACWCRTMCLKSKQRSRSKDAKISMGEYIDKREKLTRKKFWNQLDEDVEYSSKQLDDKVVNPNQIRLIIQAVQ